MSPNAENGDNFGQIVPHIGLRLALAMLQYVESTLSATRPSFRIPVWAPVLT
jgi:hypothetical protein